MKKFRNALILVLCALLLVGGTFAATLAYLTSNDQVVNSFSVGDIEITLDEAETDEYGVAVAPENRVEANDYLLVPNKEYSKDPKVHVTANSENSYIFVKIENNIADALVAGDLEAQLAANNWELVEGETNVYYYKNNYTKTNAVVDIPVFETISVKPEITNTELANAAKNKQIVITAYAVQMQGFGNAKAAWEATFCEVTHA